MALFDCFMDEYHQVRFDNLYMSAKFSLGSFNRPKKVMIEGVSSTSSRGVPTQIFQREVTTKESINDVKSNRQGLCVEGGNSLGYVSACLFLLKGSTEGPCRE